MATALGRIQNFSNSLTPNEMKVAEYLLNNAEVATTISIHEVAKNSAVSVATVSRLAATLGYKNWKDLRQGLLDDIENNQSLFTDIREGDPGELVIKKIFDCSVFSLNETFAQINKQNILDVAEAIKNTKRIVFFGTGRSGCFAREEALRFAHFDLSAEAYSDEYQITLQSSRLKKGDLAFGFSNSGRSSATVQALRQAQENGALAIGIANYHYTPLEEVSDIYFCTSFPRIGEISASLTARIALLCIMDAIYVLTTHCTAMTTRLEQTDALIDTRLRIASKGRQNGK